MHAHWPNVMNDMYVDNVQATRTYLRDATLVAVMPITGIGEMSQSNTQLTTTAAAAH